MGSSYFKFSYQFHLQINYTMSETQTNAKWDNDAHLKFIELCELEIRKEIDQTHIYPKMDGKIRLKHSMKKWEDVI